MPRPALLTLHPPSLSAPHQVFNQLLNIFLTERRGYLSDLVLGRAPGSNVTTVLASRVWMIHTASADDGTYGRRAINAIQATERAINSQIFPGKPAGGKDAVFVNSGEYIFYEGDKALRPMTLEVRAAALSCGVGGGTEGGCALASAQRVARVARPRVRSPRISPCAVPPQPPRLG
jgi:hypothetical protein